MHFVSVFSAGHRCRITCLRRWPKLRCLSRDSRVFWGGLRGSAGVFGMALAAALTVLMALLAAGLASQDKPPPALTVTCKEDGPLQHQTVTAAGTVLTVECPASCEIYPPANEQQVCKTTQCTAPEPLTSYAPGAVAEAVKESKSKMTITFKEPIKTSTTFYLKCTQEPPGKTCNMEVILKKPSTGPSGDDEPPQLPPSDSGTPGVQICKQEDASITLKIPERGSTALFACKGGFDLYPKEATKVFSKDCKKEETLSGMTRTDTPPAGEENGARSEESKTYTYTLKADKKPSKKTLCYLCAKHDITQRPPGTAEDYCTIYVESGARTQLDFIFTFALALPCVLAAFQFARA